MPKARLARGIILALVVWPLAAAAATPYKAILRGGNERPPVATRGAGRALVNADPATKTISWSVSFRRLGSPVVSAYIRCAARVGVKAAGIAVQLGDGSDLQSPLTGTGRLTAAHFADLQDGRCWINIGTAAHRGGEISGRLHR